MLGLIASLSRVFYNHTNKQGLLKHPPHKHVGIGGSRSKIVWENPEAIQRETKRQARIDRIKWGRVSIDKTGERIHYAPPQDRTTLSEGHKIMYIAYEYKDGVSEMRPAKSFVFSLPAGITDSVTTEWDDESSAVKRIMASIVGSPEDRDAGTMNRIKEEISRVKAGIGASFQRDRAAFAFQDFYFKSVTKRDFSFSHKMTPQSEWQSTEMKNIVDWIQYYSSPRLKESKTTLFAPSEWDIHFLSDGTDNPFLPKIGRCILESVSINNTPNDSFQPSENNYPNDVDIELTFKEINIRTAEDIKSNNMQGGRK